MFKGETDIGTIVAAMLLFVPAMMSAVWSRKSKNELKHNNGSSTKDAAVGAQDAANRGNVSVAELSTVVTCGFDKVNGRLDGMDERLTALEQGSDPPSDPPSDPA